MAPNSRTLAWKIPWMEEPGRLQSMGLLRVGHDWATSLSLFTFMRWRRKWQPTPVFLPRESCRQRSLVGCLYGVKESQTLLKQLSMHACIGEGNGNPLQYSCLENPRDREAWWAAISGVTQSRTRLKRLSSSSSSSCINFSAIFFPLCFCIKDLTTESYLYWWSEVLKNVQADKFNTLKDLETKHIDVGDRRAPI